MKPSEKPRVFISYSRAASAPDAKKLRVKLGSKAFLDEKNIPDGADFPQALLDALLNSSIVVIFAATGYLDRWFCRLEMRLALEGEQVILALGDGAKAVLDAMPVAIARKNWPPANEKERIAKLVEDGLSKTPPTIGAKVGAVQAKRIATAFSENSKLPEPRALGEIPHSLPPGMSMQSIGERFVGRADLLRKIDRYLSGGHGKGARLTGSIAAGGGFGKTRVAVEYMHRYCEKYPGGVFCINADSTDLDGEMWRVLKTINTSVPRLDEMRKEDRNVAEELAAGLKGIKQPVLYVVDNIPESENPRPIHDFCPAVGEVVVLATSRQKNIEGGVKTFDVETLEREAAILLLTDEVREAPVLSWDEWGQIAESVGGLPLALDLLNRSLVVSEVAPRTLFERISKGKEAHGALKGQVPDSARRGITSAFTISYKNLNPEAQRLARLLALLAPEPIPEVIMEALPEGWATEGTRRALRERHFVTSAEQGSVPAYGVMHRLMADFLRGIAGQDAEELMMTACAATDEVMTLERCEDPRHWPLMGMCRPHAESLFARGDSMGMAERAETCLPLTEMGINVGLLDREQGDFSGAQGIEETVLQVRRRVLGEEHQATLTAMANLASTLSSLGDHAAARGLRKRALEVSQRVLGNEHEETLIHMNNLAKTLWDIGAFSEARGVQEQVLEVRKRVLGKEHPQTLISISNLAGSLAALGEHREARKLEERVLRVRKRVLGEKHPDTLISMNNLATTLFESGDREGSIRLLRECVALRREVLGENHPKTLQTAESLKNAEEQLDGPAATES